LQLQQQSLQCEAQL